MVFVPDVARTEAGFFLDVEPVRSAKLSDLQSLASAIEEAMAMGNPRVPTPTRAAFPAPVILKPAGLKNWNAFVKRGACFTIFRDEGGIEITETGCNDDGEWVDDPSLNQKLSGGSPTLDIATRIAERVRRRPDLV
jgi:hypothetical protein